ncbi:MarR family winged helix-turn-helix transcriptional regulator [Pseudonocardia sp. RS010]|uniref:MarR family winged helix-turn-helix transcriptional regulator n=1 Tax=Pseudonocardia sp. RS010 TaxID=3385979 RepID=UPI0039A1D1D5
MIREADPARGPELPDGDGWDGAGTAGRADHATVPAPRRREPDGPVRTAQLSELLHRLGADTTRLVEVFARTKSLRASDVEALLAVRSGEEQDEPVTPGVLSQGLMLTSGAVTGLVDRLVRAGHVVREPDESDRRRVRLRTTPAGADVALEFDALLGACTDGAARGFGAGEMATVERFLADVTATTTSCLWSLETRVADRESS